jgi:hypothetical protein
VSDVAAVRPQCIEGHEDGAGLTSVLLTETPRSEDSPIQTVLFSLKTSLQGLNNNSKYQNNVSSENSVTHLPIDNMKSPETPLIVPCGSNPVNEFQENDALFLGAFPDLFILGRKFPTTGTVQHLL